MSQDRLDRLAEELRQWTGRPGSLSPRAARTRVLATLPDRRPRPRWGLVTAGAALAALALAAALLVDSPGPPVDRTVPPTADPTHRIIVHQLSSGTKLYIVMRPDSLEDEC